MGHVSGKCGGADWSCTTCTKQEKKKNKNKKAFIKKFLFIM